MGRISAVICLALLSQLKNKHNLKYKVCSTGKYIFAFLLCVTVGMTVSRGQISHNGILFIYLWFPECKTHESMVP